MKKVLMLLLTLSFFCVGCSQQDDKDYPTSYPSSPSVSIDEIMFPEVLEKKVIETEYVKVDYSLTNQGYILAKLKKASSKRIKIEISKDDFPYRYDITDLNYVALPLQMENGQYTIKILRQIEGTKYAISSSEMIQVKLDDELLPYLYPNQLVYYTKNSSINSLAIECVKDDTNDLQRIKDIYEYVVNYLTYDDEKAIESQQRYILPDLENLLTKKQGICFDYASMMCAMLRINHIPARLICGDTDVEYHAWVEVYLNGEGWINPDVFIDKEIWSRMDPTFASSKFQYDGEYKAIYYY